VPGGRLVLTLQDPRRAPLAGSRLRCWTSASRFASNTISLFPRPAKN